MNDASAPPLTPLEQEALQGWRALYQRAFAAGNLSSLAIRTARDLTLIDLLPGLILVVACDSQGAIGDKPHDKVRVSNHVLGRAAARVPLMELLACGAMPLLLIDTLMMEMNPTGQAVIAGLRAEMEQAGLTGVALLTGSTEDNVPTTQSGIGTVALGLATPATLRVATAREGDWVICVGHPTSGPGQRVDLEHDPALLDLPSVQQIMALTWVHECVPVGSHGIAYECAHMALGCGLIYRSFERDDTQHPIDMAASAGPSTCGIAAIHPSHGALEAVRSAVPQPITLIGWLTRRGH